MGKQVLVKTPTAIFSIIFPWIFQHVSHARLYFNKWNHHLFWRAAALTMAFPVHQNSPWGTAVLMLFIEVVFVVCFVLGMLWPLVHMSGSKNFLAVRHLSDRFSGQWKCEAKPCLIQDLSTYKQLRPLYTSISSLPLFIVACPVYRPMSVLFVITLIFNDVNCRCSVFRCWSLQSMFGYILLHIQLMVLLFLLLLMFTWIHHHFSMLPDHSKQVRSWSSLFLPGELGSWTVAMTGSETTCVSTSTSTLKTFQNEQFCHETTWYFWVDVKGEDYSW